MNYLNELKKLEILHVDNYQYIEIKKLNKDEYLLHQGEKLNYIYILIIIYYITITKTLNI